MDSPLRQHQLDMPATRRAAARVRRLAEQLLSAESHLKDFLSASPDGILVLDPAGVVLFSNAAAEGLFDARPGTLKGRHLGSPLTPESPPNIEIPRAGMPPVSAQLWVARTTWECSPAFVASFRDVSRLIWTRQALQRSQLRLAQTVERFNRIVDGSVNALVRAVESRDLFTACHQKRVAQLSVSIARELSLQGQAIEGVRVAGLLHDLGKIQIPVELLCKPGCLNAPEINIMRTHPEVGHAILSRIDFPWPIADMVLQHHERIDGSGYPHGLSGTEILLEARILAVADVVEAIASDRPYRPGKGIPEALREIRSASGRLYDPGAVEACHGLFGDGRFRFASPSATATSCS